MSAIAVDASFQDYLRRLDKALTALPRSRRSQLVAEITDHIAAPRSELDDPTEAEIRNLLDHIGRPEEIAAEASTTDAPRKSRPLQENLVIALLLFDGLLVGVGWFVGVVLLWTSSVWRVRDKVLGTLLCPGGLVLPLFASAVLGATAHGTACVQSIPAGGTPAKTCEMVLATGPPPWIARTLLGAIVIVPVVVAVHLHRMAHQRCLEIDEREAC